MAQQTDDSVSSFHAMNIMFICASVVSTVCSCSIIATGLIFGELRKRLFMKIIMNIALATTIATATSSFGMVSNSPLCSTQSFCTAFLYKASWLWTTVLSYHLYSIVYHGYFSARPLLLHTMCWMLPLVATLLPLSTNSYGRSDDDFVLGWCFLDGNENFAAGWSAGTMTAFLVICVLLNLFLLARIFRRYRTMDVRATYPEVYYILRSMVIYPASFIVTWSPNLIFSIIINFGTVDPHDLKARIVFNILAAFATQFGTVLAICFYCTSDEARWKWYCLLNTARRLPTGTSTISHVGSAVSERSRGTTTVFNEDDFQRSTTSEVLDFPIQNSTESSDHIPAPTASTFNISFSFINRNSLLSHSFFREYDPYPSENV
jgi:hypothetical protein